MIRKKRLLIGLAVIPVLFLIIFFNLTALLEVTLKYQLTRLGMSSPVVSIAQVGLHEATISRLGFTHRVDDRRVDLASRDIQLYYSLRGLLTGQLNRVIVSAVDIKVDEQFASTKEVSQFNGMSKLPVVADIPLQSLRINKARVFIKQTEQSTIQLDASTVIEKSNGGLEANLDVLQKGYAGVQAKITVTQEGAINLSVHDLNQRNVLLSVQTEKLAVMNNALKTQLKSQADFKEIVKLLHAWGFARDLSKVSGTFQLMTDFHIPLQSSMTISQRLDKTRLQASMTLAMTAQQWSGVAREMKVDLPLTVSIKKGLLSWEFSDKAQIGFIPEHVAHLGAFEILNDLSQKVEGQRLQLTFPGGLQGQTKTSDGLGQENIRPGNVIKVAYGNEKAALRLALLLQSPSLILHPEIQLHSKINYSMQIPELSKPDVRSMRVKGSAVFNVSKDKANISFEKDSKFSVQSFKYNDLKMKNSAVSLNGPTQCQMHWADANWSCSPFTTHLIIPEIIAGDISGTTNKGVVKIHELSKNKAGLILKTNIQFSDLRPVLGDYVLNFNHLQADIELVKSQINGQALLQGVKGAVKAKVALSHNLDLSTGMLDYRLLPMDFSSTKSLLDKIVTSPPLPVQINAGVVSVNGRYAWKPLQKKSEKSLLGRLSSAISVKNVNGRFNAIEFQGLSSDLALAANQGLSFEKPAHVKIALINAGVPVTDINFKLHGKIDKNKKAQISLDDLSANTLDGRLDSEKIELDLNRSSNPFVIHFHQLSLAKLLQLEQDQGLSGTGVIDGILPFDYKSGQGLFMQQGKVYAKAPGGLLQYKATDRVKEMANSNPNIKLLLDALNNFNYNKLDADANYTADGNLNLKVSLKGNNPEFQKGRPVHLNVNVEENILQLLRSLQLGDEIGERLGERVLKQ